MIDKILVSGYKCLLMKEPLTTKALNVLVGSNASGKSTLLQTMLLLRQSADANGVVHDLHLSGDLYEGGTANDVLHPSAEHKIRVLLVDNGKNSDFTFLFKREDTSVKKRQLQSEKATKIIGCLGADNSCFGYLNAERIGPRVSYPLPPDDIGIAGAVGKHGEYTAGRLARSADGVFISGWSEEICKKISDAQDLLDGKVVEKELLDSDGRLDLVSNNILNWIIPGAVFHASEEDNIDSAPLRFLRDPTSTRVKTRATHVGFGLAYSLPIIVAGLSLTENGMLVVENPEAHLHPYSQSRIGVFLALLAGTGRQVFVETHSDHVVNGIRLAIKHNLVHADSVIFNYFRNFPDEGCSEITQILADTDGSLDAWPAGFFDQIERDLARL